MRIDSPLARLHVVTKVVAILATSLLIVRLMDARNPDPLGTAVLLVAGFLILILSGAGRWLYRSYLIVIYPMLTVLFITWIIFNPDPGAVTYLKLPLHDGVLDLQLTPWLPLFLGAAYLAQRLSGRWWLSLLAGLAVAQGVAWLGWWPTPPLIRLARFPFKPLALVVSDANLLVALSKVMGYAAMVFISLTLVMTTRDIDFIGAMRQLRVPYTVTFFLTLVLRALNSAVMDYETIQQAQLARGTNLQPRTPFNRIHDLAHMSVPLVATMIRRSAEMSDAVIARGFRLDGAPPSEFREAQALTRNDLIVLAFQALLLAAVFGLSINLTQMAGLR